MCQAVVPGAGVAGLVVGAAARTSVRTANPILPPAALLAPALVLRVLRRAEVNHDPARPLRRSRVPQPGPDDLLPERG